MKERDSKSDLKCQEVKLLGGTNTLVATSTYSEFKTMLNLTTTNGGYGTTELAQSELTR